MKVEIQRAQGVERASSGGSELNKDPKVHKFPFPLFVDRFFAAGWRRKQPSEGAEKLNVQLAREGDDAKSSSHTDERIKSVWTEAGVSDPR